MCTGDGSVEVPPSPKFQEYVVRVVPAGVVDVDVKDTVSHPVVAVVNCATGRANNDSAGKGSKVSLHPLALVTISVIL